MTGFISGLKVRCLEGSAYRGVNNFLVGSYLNYYESPRLQWSSRPDWRAWVRVKRRVQGSWDIYQVSVLKSSVVVNSPSLWVQKETRLPHRVKGGFCLRKSLLGSLSHTPEHVSTLLQDQIPLKSEQICMVIIQWAGSLTHVCCLWAS